MDMHSQNVREVIRRYRKPLIVAFVAITGMLTLAILGAGYAVYKTASFATDKLKTLQPGVTETASQLPAQASGLVEGVILNVASGWLQQGVASGEVAQVKSGLSCFDALGGSSPVEIVGYVQRTVTDTALTTQLQELSAKLNRDGAAISGPSACASWILNS